ncbi:MAG: penicillin-binding transpeptidase domain-containing protein [Dermatophilaceae bacterium]
MSRRVVAVLPVLGLVVVTSLGGCSLLNRPPSPDDTARSLAVGLAAPDLTKVPFDGASGESATASVKAAFGDLAQTPRSIAVTRVATGSEDKKATATLTWTWDVSASPVDWTYSTDAALVLAADNTWHVQWSPTLVEPRLNATERLRVDRSQGKRAEILGASGTVLMGPRDVYRLGIDRGKISADQAGPSAGALAKLLGIDEASYVKTVTGSGPKQFVVALTVRVDDPLVAGKSDAIAAIPGASQVPDTATLGPSSTFARSILGTVGPATAEIVARSGGAVAATDTVGLSGLEQRYDGYLAGLPGLRVKAVGSDAAGAATARILFTQDPVAGRQLSTTLDVSAQNAAEAALAPATVAATLVAVRPSTGEIVAAANGPVAQGAVATTGRAAPGSTFKIVSSLALLRAGLTPESTVSCDPTVVVDGRTFKNYDDYPAGRLGQITLRAALANSCNTAFISNHDKVSQGDLVDAAAALGFGVDFDMGMPAFLGSVPRQATATEHAASMIGQAKVEASALSMATVVASVAKGATVVPHLVDLPTAPVAPATAVTGSSGAAAPSGSGPLATGPVAGIAGGSSTSPGATPSGASASAPATATATATATPTAALPTKPPAPAKPLQPAEVEALRSMLASVVSDGSGRVLADAGVSGAKTGTAEFGTDTPPKTHAWMVAIRGDLAVVVYVDEGQSGSKTAAPLLKAFLAAYTG